MRFSGVLCYAMLVTGVQAAKPDSAVYPNANFYRDPAISAASGYAKVIREYCPGFGRGQIHFLNLDGELIRIRRTWPTYLELAPGEHRLGMEFIGTANDIWSTWNGEADVVAHFESGKTYAVRYQRAATDKFRVWIEEYQGLETIDMATKMCQQSEFPDKGLHQ